MAVEPTERSRPPWLLALALLLLLASLANGAPFLLARIGWIAPQAYQRDRQAFCPADGPPAGLVSACSPLRRSNAAPAGFERLSLQRLHRPPPSLVPLKAARLLLLLGLPLVLLTAMFLGRCPWPCGASLLPALPLLVSLGCSLAVSLLQAPRAALLQALFSLAWLPLLLLAGPCSRAAVLARLAQAMAALLLLQLPLMGLEALRGLPMSFGLPADQFAQASLGLPTRLVGSFIQPNSLGVAMVVLLSFCIAWLPQRRLLPALALLTLPPLLLARSATGLFGWVVLMLVWGGRGHRLSRVIRLAALAFLAAFVASLPLILGRLDLWQSLTGRVSRLAFLLQSSDPWQWLWGQGLLASSPTDSLPTLLIRQGGVLALLGFYGLLLWAWHRDQPLQPFLLAVLLGSLTLPITELFPVNLLLALSLHRVLRVAAADDPHAQPG